MKKLCFAILTLLSFSVFAQVESSQEDNAFYKIPPFHFEGLNFQAVTEGKTRLDVFVQVPFSTIQFLKEDNLFIANYRVTASIYTKDGETLKLEKSWKEQAKTDRFEQTNAKNNYNLSVRSFELPPDEYILKVAIEDEETENRFRAEKRVDVREISKPFGLSDIMMVASTSQLRGKMKIVPNVSLNVASQESGMPIFFEAYADSTGPVTITYAITNAEDEVLTSSDSTFILNKGATQLYFDFKETELTLGDYKYVVLLNPESGEQVSVGKKFFSRWIGVPNSPEALELAVDQMTYIANGDDIDYILEGETFEQRLERFMNYWDQKDPSPNTANNEIFNEYYRRIEYANQNFTKMLDGWRTDMGMVYIILGPPDDVERHPFEYNSKPYEIWEYYQMNRAFVFVDQTGFGDYRLITPFYGDMYFRPR